MRVSVITAVRNGEGVIADTLRSVASQDYDDIEHIVVDGASVDRTLEVIECDGQRVTKVVSEADRGVYDALNRGIGMATGDVILCLHAGDVYQSSRVISRVAAEFHGPPVDIVFADVLMTASDDRDKVRRLYSAAGFVPEDLAAGLMPPHPTLAVRRWVFDAFGGYNQSYPIASDFDFCIRTMLRGNLNYRYIPEVLVRMPVGGLSNRSWLSPILNTGELLRVCRDNGVQTSWLRLAGRLFVKWRMGDRARLKA